MYNHYLCTSYYYFRTYNHGKTNHYQQQLRLPRFPRSLRSS
jgi:hypothetical protein